MVSEDRCPYCHGIQVKIMSKHDENVTSQAWIERLSPTTIRGSVARSPLLSLSSLSSPSPGLHYDGDDDNKKLASQSRDSMDTDAMVELDEQYDDEAELEQTSESSPRHYHEFDDNNEEDVVGLDRPYNPVALLLATTTANESPSSVPTNNGASEINKNKTMRSENLELKQTSKERRIETDPASSTPEKKQRVLFAM